MIEKIDSQEYAIRENLTLGELSDIQDASTVIDKMGLMLTKASLLRVKLIAMCVEGMTEEKAAALPAAVGMRLYVAIQRVNKIPLFD